MAVRRVVSALRLAATAVAAACAGTAAVAAMAATAVPPHLELVGGVDYSLLNSSTPPASAALKYGFEGGMVDFMCGRWHLFATEMLGDPHWIDTDCAHWVSDDGLSFERVGTLMKGSGNKNGTDERSHVDAPMVVFNASSGFYELFYVAYWHGVAGCDITSCNGSLWRAVSTVSGCSGIGGPYRDVGKVLQMDSHHQDWEGDQGDDSISPPRQASDGSWVAFYGSSKEVSGSGRHWDVGLMNASSLAGPWQRLAVGNPVLAPTSENPVVTVLPASRVFDGWRYVAVFDQIHEEALGNIGVVWSKDMYNWSEIQSFNVHGNRSSGTQPWTKTARTPQGLAWDPQRQLFRLYYTAWETPRPPGLEFDRGDVGLAYVKIVPPSSKW